MNGGGVLQAAGDAARAIETVSWVLIIGSLAIFLENLRALREGRRPPNQVDLARGY